jgi:hypothetical protein
MSERIEKNDLRKATELTKKIEYRVHEEFIWACKVQLLKL